MNKTILSIGIIAVLIVGLFTYLGLPKKSAPALPAGKLPVAASFYPLYFFAQEIGGDKAEVQNVTPAGGEPHDYEPTAQDIARIENDKLLILNGGGLEAWGEKIRQNIDPKKTLLVTAGEGLTTQKVVEEGETVTDPHVWLSPPLAAQMVDKIEAGFAEVDPANADYYASNASVLKSKLQTLDAEYRQGLTNCAKKDIITSHAAFGYVASTYHLHQVSITGLSPDAEPSPKELADIARFAKKNDVKVIFFESLVSPKLAQTLASEVGAKTMVLDPIEGLTQGDLATGKNYLTEMEQNLAHLKIALQCAP